jgi:hypothetical protein
MKRIFEGEEKEIGARELPGRFRYPVSWNAGEKSGLRLYRSHWKGTPQHDDH